MVAAHPSVPLPGSAWEFGFDHVDALEVWNGRWNLDDELSLRIWQRLLRQGRRVVAVGGSDSHGEHQQVGSPQTVVHADGLSVPAIVDGLRCGRSYLARSRDVALELTATADDGVAGPGQTLRVPSGASVTVTAVISGARRRERRPDHRGGLRATGDGRRVSPAAMGPRRGLSGLRATRSTRSAAAPAGRDGRIHKSGVVQLSGVSHASPRGRVNTVGTAGINSWGMDWCAKRYHI